MMAERRYGFRFSFAEGCVVVACLFIASFLVFLFGVYAGRELEARKAADHASSVRLTTTGEGQSHPGGQEGVASTVFKEGREKALPSLPATQEGPKTVVVVNPPTPKPDDSPTHLPTPATPPPQVEAEVKPQPPSLAARVPAEHRAAASPIPPSRSVPEKPPPPKAAAIEPLKKKLQTAGGRWSVQLQATRDEGAAQQLVKQLRGQGYAPVMSKVTRDGETWYRVRVGSFTTADDARTAVGRLRREGKFSQAYPVSN
jgi:septal ring-binding cell division protein DamX